MAIRTEISEIVTGLGLFGFRDLKRALAARPRFIANVDDAVFDRLDHAHAAGAHAELFAVAWHNGTLFARADDGLRGRPPWHVEWKGPHRPPAYEQIPADLRVDHVYLISCKYGSNILMNASPWHLFERSLTERRTERADWYVEVAPEAHQELYRAARDELDLTELPERATDLGGEQRALLKSALGRRWPATAARVYSEFAHAVAHASAERWRAQMVTPARREEMLWRLLRLQAAPYFVLGASPSSEPITIRVGTPWDFRERFGLRAFDAWGDPVGQPLVRWRADVEDRVDGCRRIIEGHVEVRWSHGKFAGAPEAKVYLDTPHHEVAGYHPID
ncbi:MAG: hypothetical protein ACE5GB_02410 [Acidimicrobiales bacterium]